MGYKTGLRQLGPGMVTQQHAPCDNCHGTGQTIREKERCKKCKGKRVVEERKTLSFYIDRGAKDGDRIVLEGAADEDPDVEETGDVVFVLREKKHAVFERAGPHLKASISIQLVEALCGFSRVVLTLLDGRGLKITQKVGSVLTPGQVLVVPGEGMPLGRKLDAKGNLFLEVQVQFPSRNFLSDTQEYQRLAELLPPRRPVTEDEHEEVDEVAPAMGSLDDFEKAQKQEAERDEADDGMEDGPQCSAQ